MSYAQSVLALNEKRQQIEALREEMRAIQARIEPESVTDYEFAGWDGPVTLSALFGDKRDLFVIHNMGTGCPACTMWADGFNGVYDHLPARAAFVVASPNPVAVQKTFLELYKQHKGEYFGSLLTGMVEGMLPLIKNDTEEVDLTDGTFEKGLNNVVKDNDLNFPPEWRLSRSGRAKP